MSCECHGVNSAAMLRCGRRGWEMSCLCCVKRVEKTCDDCNELSGNAAMVGGKCHVYVERGWEKLVIIVMNSAAILRCEGEREKCHVSVVWSRVEKNCDIVMNSAAMLLRGMKGWEMSCTCYVWARVEKIVMIVINSATMLPCRGRRWGMSSTCYVERDVKPM